MNYPALPEFQLTGAPCIVRDKLKELLTSDYKPSVSLLARQTGYTEETVRSALIKLHELGLVKYQCYRNGCRAEYEVIE